MKRSCIPIEELARVAALPAGDPERVHVDGCARCRSLLAMLAEFESPGVSRAGARFADADAHLRSTIAGLAAGGEPDAPVHGVNRSAPRRERGSWLARLLPLWPRPVYGFAALVVVVLSGTLLVRTMVHGPQLRDASPGAATAFAAHAVREVAGGLELSWPAYAGADRYRVVFLDASLAEIVGVDAGAGTTFVLRESKLPAALTHGASVGWQVEAYAGADLRATTATRALVVP